MKQAVRTMLIAASMWLSGCAAMFHGTTEQVSIHSNDPDATLYVNGGYVGRGHAITTFKKNKDYTVSARKEGCSEFTMPVSKSFDAVTLLGVLIDFGIVSVLLVDGAATGAWQDFDQTNYVVDPQCSSSLAAK